VDAGINAIRYRSTWAMSDPHGRRNKTVPREAPKVQQWQKVVVLELPRREAREFLTIGQYVHVTDFVKQLVGFGRRAYDMTMRISPLGDFWELKEKGGLLGRINVRVYFAHVKENNEIVVLSTFKKEDDGQAPSYIIYRLRNRLRLYLAGELREGIIEYQRLM
jgi:hypothetical protein